MTRQHHKESQTGNLHNNFVWLPLNKSCYKRQRCKHCFIIILKESGKNESVPGSKIKAGERRAKEEESDEPNPDVTQGEEAVDGTASGGKLSQ